MSSISKPSISNSHISDIEWSMIDKKRYFPLTIINMFAVRSLLYPLTLVRTRLQVQTRGSLYTGTINALQSVVKYEGFLSLYKGYWVNSFQLVPHVLYITSYEVSWDFLIFCVGDAKFGVLKFSIFSFWALLRLW
jgi:solute carrier family 25 protein 44